MSSPYTLILNDVKALVSAVSGFTPAANRVVRKNQLVMPGDPLPLCVIVPFFQTKDVEAAEARIIKGYTVGIVLVFSGNWSIESGLENIIDATYGVEKVLHVTQLLTASIFDSDINLNPDRELFNLSAIEANYDYSLMTVTYYNEEARNA